MIMEAPDLFESAYLRAGNTQLTPEKRPADSKSGDHFIVEDLFDFSNDDAVFGEDCCTFETITGNSTESSTVTGIDSCNSSFSAPGDFSCGGNIPASDHLSDDLSVPYDDLAELEWLSNFVEESFSSEDLQKLQLISGMKAPTTAEETVSIKNEETLQPAEQKFRPEMAVPGKARSKRSRAAPCDWSSRLLVLSPTPPPATSITTATTSSSESVASNSGKKTPKVATTTGGGRMKKELGTYQNKGAGEGRKCLHCATDQTPQWRTGPMGPKTLCNACGVRYKSGRLVPEYRPAASPTFVLTKHSNSHRKVLELRRQKELQLSQQQQFLYPNANACPAAIFDIANASGGSTTEEYLIHRHSGPDFRQLI